MPSVACYLALRKSWYLLCSHTRSLSAHGDIAPLAQVDARKARAAPCGHAHTVLSSVSSTYGYRFRSAAAVRILPVDLVNKCCGCAARRTSSQLLVPTDYQTQTLRMSVAVRPTQRTWAALRQPGSVDLEKKLNLSKHSYKKPMSSAGCQSSIVALFAKVWISGTPMQHYWLDNWIVLQEHQCVPVFEKLDGMSGRQLGSFHGHCEC